MSKNNKPILIVDEDLGFYEKFKNDPLRGHFVFDIVDSASTAQKYLKENRGAYAACLISPEVKKPSGFSVAKCALMYQPTTPIYMFETINGDLLEDFDHVKMGLAGMIPKPFNLKLLVEKLGPILRIVDQDKLIEMAKANKDKLGEESADTDPNFRSIQAELFISGSKSFFDVYVKLRSDKYIKILQSGDTFDYERVMDYLNKGVSYFYIRKEALESYMNYCDKLTNAVNDNKGIDLKKKFGFVLNQAEVTMRTLVDLGVDSDNIAYAGKYLKNVCHLVETHGKKSSFLEGLLKDISRFEHSGSVVMVSAMLGKATGVETTKGLEVLGMAAFFHDIGMVEQADNEDMYSDGKDTFYQEEDVVAKLESKKVYGDELKLLEKLWLTHPERGARMIENEKGVSALLPQIIRQHHAHRDKREGRFKGGSVHPMAEIVEISDIFVRIMKSFHAEDANKPLLVKKLMAAISDFPKRTREPFMEVFNLTH